MSVIEIKNLSKRFVVEGHTVDALRDVNMSIEAGDIYGIIGMSGAGKSTLVRSINYLEKPTEGEVRIDGINLAGLSRTELRKMRGTIGMIFQNFNLLEQRDVLGNICFPLEIVGVGKRDGQGESLSIPAFRRPKAESSHCESNGDGAPDPSVR